MEILRYGNPNNRIILLIHGFESPHQIWEEYIKYFERDFHVIVPILPGHNPNMPEDFESFEKCAEELENFLIGRYGYEVYAVYGMSMGGVLASYLWENRNIHIQKLIMESSPLLSYSQFITDMLTKQYLKITHKAQKRDKATVHGAVGSMVTEDKLEDFLELLDNISDTTIRNYIREIGQYRLLPHISTEETQIVYFYGGKLSEVLFRKVAKYIRKNYPAAETVCFPGKGHCQDALLNPTERIRDLSKYIV